jgi:hypothetical protein
MTNVKIELINREINYSTSLKIQIIVNKTR